MGFDSGCGLFQPVHLLGAYNHIWTAVTFSYEIQALNLSAFITLVSGITGDTTLGIRATFPDKVITSCSFSAGRERGIELFHYASSVALNGPAF